MRDLRRKLGTLFSVSYHADRRRFLSFITLIAIWQALPLVGAALVRSLINGVARHHPTTVTVTAVLLGLAGAATFVAARARSRTIHVLIEKTTEAYDRRLIALSCAVPGIEHLENPEFLDKLEQLHYQPQVLGLCGPNSTVVIWGLIQATLVVALLVSVNPWLLILPGVAWPSLWAARRAERARQQAFEAASVARRQANHFFELATTPASADEVRTLRIGPTLLQRHDQSWADSDRTMTAVEVKAAVTATAGRLVFALVYLGAVVFVVEEGIRGSASLGDIVLTVILAGLINQQLAVIMNSVGLMFYALAMIDKFLWLVDYAAAHTSPPSTATVPDRLHHGIDLHQVTFRYPGTDHDVVRDLTVHLPAGAVVAVVGDNGAGKSTLVKLLTAMYQTNHGAITVDGVDLGTFDPHLWRLACTAAFQDFARLELLLQESVGVGDLDRVDHEPTVLDALDQAGGQDLVTQLELGLATPIGASFEAGADLSGGQWQKIALGRALMRPVPLLVILDEPTASLDPLAEQELFDRYTTYAHHAAAGQGTITLIISHRFSTVRMADLIVVLDDGAIREAGSHHQLVEHNGLYAELYRLQAAGYQ